MQPMVASYYPPYFVLFLIAPFVLVPLWLMALAAGLALGGQSAVKVTRRLVAVALVVTVPFTLIGLILMTGGEDAKEDGLWSLWVFGIVWMPAVLCASWHGLASLLERRAAASGRTVTSDVRKVALGAGVFGWLGCVAGLYYLPQVLWP